MAWKIVYFRDEDGLEPVRLFYDQELLPGEKKRLETRLEFLKMHGISILGRRKDILETLEGKKFEGLYSLRFPNSLNNPRVLVCTLIDEVFVLLHAFKELNPRAYEKAALIARKRMKLVLEAQKKALEAEKPKEQDLTKAQRAKQKERKRK